MQSVIGIGALCALFAAKFGFLLGGRAAVEQDFFSEKKPCIFEARPQVVDTKIPGVFVSIAPGPGGGYENP